MPRTFVPDTITKLRGIHSALDDALGDTDIDHLTDEDDLRDAAPVQWAAQQIVKLIEELETR